MVFKYVNTQYTLCGFDHRRHWKPGCFQSKWKVENGYSSCLLSAVGLTSSQVTRAASGQEAQADAYRQAQRDLAAQSARGSEAERECLWQSHSDVSAGPTEGRALHHSGCDRRLRSTHVTSSPEKAASFLQPLLCSHFLFFLQLLCLMDGVHSFPVWCRCAT